MKTSDRFELDQKFLARFGGDLFVPEQVAIVGAGRWARVLCRVLAELSPPIANIHLVARRNYDETRRWIEEERSNGNQPAFDRVTVTPSLDAVLKRGEVRVAFVTKMASEHYHATRELLLAGKHVLVEKPFVLRSSEAEELVRIAEEQGRALVVGYELMFSPALHRLREAIDEHLDGVSSAELVWRDTPGVVKWGVPKRRDLSANVITDLLPHVLSQLHVLLGRGEVDLKTLRSDDACWRAEVEIAHGSIPVKMSLDKEADVPSRTIRVRSHSGDVLELDYTEEPGRLSLGGTPLPVDLNGLPRSLTTELAYFFAHTEKSRNGGSEPPELPNSARSTLHFVSSTEAADSRLADHQRRALRRHLWTSADEGAPEPVLKILRQRALAPLLAHELVTNPKDTATIDAWATRMYRIVRRFSRDPWTEQREVLESEGLSKNELIALNAALRESDFLQGLMIKEGTARQYWKSILPLVETGAVPAVLANQYQFPLRVGIYAAVSCMFYCTFCGRKHGVKYAGSDVAPGNDIFDQVFEAMPQGISTLSLGGGLEPLTNPRLDEVIRSAKRHGHRVPLVTNAYMLTPKFVERHDGLWDLDVFRISFYGVDEDSYYRVTGRRGAFELVKANLIEFLKERNRRGSRLKVGLNFIVLVDTTDQVLELLDVIGEVNDAVDGPGVDFLTLREDFSVPETEGLTPDERRRLVEIFREFNARRESELPDLRVDFGYALYPLSGGLVGKPLAMVTHEGMLPRAYPQVSVAIDLLGDVYLYRDAAFLEREGADRYIIGRISKERSLERVIRDFLESGREITPLPGDPALMDAFDHVVTKLLWQARADEKLGIPFDLGPVRDRCFSSRGREVETQPKVVNYWQSLFRL